MFLCKLNARLLVIQRKLTAVQSSPWCLLPAGEYVSLWMYTNLLCSFTGFIRGILRGVRYAKSLRVLFLHRRSPSWTTLVLYSRVVFIFNEPTNCHILKVFNLATKLRKTRINGRSHAMWRGRSGRIFNRLWSPGIDSKEWIPPAYVAWRAGAKTLFILGA